MPENVISIFNKESIQVYPKNTLEQEIQILRQENKKLKEENQVFKEYLCQKDPKASFCQKLKTKTTSKYLKP